MDNTNFKWKEYSSSVRLNASSRMVDYINRHIKEAEECLSHSIFNMVFTNGYRVYRRGKNRCVRCGLKLKHSDK